MADYRKTDEAIAKLTPEQYYVTQESGTERPGTGEYLGNKAAGIYVDIVSGEPLFASDRQISTPALRLAQLHQAHRARAMSTNCSDRTLGMVRTEVRSTHGDSHLGHVFPDGPRRPRRAALLHQLRLAALRRPAMTMAAQGYAAYLDQVEDVG